MAKKLALAIALVGVLGLLVSAGPAPAPTVVTTEVALLGCQGLAELQPLVNKYSATAPDDAVITEGQDCAQAYAALLNAGYVVQFVNHNSRTVYYTMTKARRIAKPN